MMEELVNGAIHCEAVAVRLGTAALDSQYGGAMETSLVPLDIYNDAATLLKDIQCSQLLPRLTEKANAALETMLGLLSKQVAQHSIMTASLSCSCYLTPSTCSRNTCRFDQRRIHHHGQYDMRSSTGTAIDSAAVPHFIYPCIWISIMHLFGSTLWLYTPIQAVCGLQR